MYTVKMKGSLNVFKKDKLRRILISKDSLEIWLLFAIFLCSQTKHEDCQHLHDILNLFDDSF